MRPERLGLLGAFLAIGLGFLMDWYGDGSRPEPRSPARPPISQRPFNDPSAVRETPAPKAAAVPDQARGPRRPLPPPSARDWEINIKPSGPKRSSTGTAFAVAPGQWLTARHVVHGCDKIGFVETGKRRAISVRGKAVEDPDADIAMVRFDRSQPPTLEMGVVPDIGDAGYHYGFPGVGKGRVSSTLLGRGNIRSQGFRGAGRQVLLWAETGREGVGPGSLGGISGGPTLDREGRLVGVAIASNTRRGRVTTIAPATIQRMFVAEHVPPGPQGGNGWTAAPSFPELERAGTVRQVYCQVDTR